jgi:hypothetical protein
MNTQDLKLFLALSFLSGVIFFSGCGNDPVTSSGNSSNDNLTMSVMSDEYKYDNNQIVITEAKALIEKVELETEPSSQSAYLRIDPFVINLNSVRSVLQAVSGQIPSGNYQKFKFQIHKPEDDQTPPDPEFKTGNSGNQRFSVIIKGIYNGNSFIYRSRKTVNMVFTFNSILNIAQSNRNVTLNINPALWFKSGSMIVDPNNQDNEDIIDDNIRDSFKRIFIDDDRNGNPDGN